MPGESIDYPAFFLIKNIIVVLGSIANWLNNLCVQILILADKVPEVLPNNLQIASYITGARAAVANSQDSLGICTKASLSYSGDRRL